MLKSIESDPIDLRAGELYDKLGDVKNAAEYIETGLMIWRRAASGDPVVFVL